MTEKIDVSIEIIVHATEDVKKILGLFLERFEVQEDEFSRDQLTGHFENPITILRTKIKKNEGKNFLGKIIPKIPQDQFSEMIRNIENFLQDSTLHLRFGKQELIKGKVVLQEKDAIKFKIFTPVYKKTDVVKNYVSLLTELR